MDLRDWSRQAMNRIAAELDDDAHWGPLLADRSNRAVHLAIFVEPFLGHILEGRKIVESRWSVRRYAPFQCVATGDIVLVKAASGPVKGICEVGTTRFEELDPAKVASIRSELAEDLCATDDAFWDDCSDARYVSLIELLAFRPVTPLECPKRDRRGWVVLEERAPVRPLRSEVHASAPRRGRRSSRPPPTW